MKGKLMHVDQTGTDAPQSEFAALLEESFKAVSVQEGEIVQGTVLGIGKDFVMVDIGFKSEGQIPIAEFRTSQGELAANCGDKVDVFVERIEDDSGLVVLSRERAEMARTWDQLADAQEHNSLIEGTVLNKVKGGLCVDIGVKAFLPGSQVDIRPSKSLDIYVGKTYPFRIIKLNKRRGNVVVSRKVVLEEQREKLKGETLSNLQEGQILEGMVKNLTEYGAFIDLGGLDGLLHITDMSWGRINHPSEIFKVGDDIRVKVLKYDSKTERVSLGYKQLQPDPWQGVDDRFMVGSRVKGKVVNITDYGAFVELEAGVEGLVHISEMSWTKKVKHPSKLVTPGQAVDAVVLDVDPENKRIALGLKQLMDNPWDTLREKFSLGDHVTGEVKNIADFGLFLDVGSEIDALAHISDLCWIQTFEAPDEVYRKEQKLEGVVLQIDPENERFAIGIKQLMDDPWDIIGKKYPVGTAVAGKVTHITKMGAVVALDDGVIGVIPRNEWQEEPAIGTAFEHLTVSYAEPKERRFLVRVESAA